MPQYKRAKPFDIVQEILDLKRTVQSLKINNRVSKLYSYTPVWTAATTNPTLGNGTLVGQYRRVGKRVFGAINVTIGSTTSVGTGSQSFTLPFPVTNNMSYVCYAIAKKASTSSTYIALGLMQNGTSSFILQLGQAAGGWTATQPFGAAWATGDLGVINFDYESDT
jgi:hypothetical protein